MITINNIQYRTLEEQVRKNKEDIEVLKNYDISITGHVNSASELPDTADNGTMYIVGTSPSYDIYVFVDDEWIDLGDFPAVGPQGPQGNTGPIGLQGERGSQWYTLQKPTVANQNDQFLGSDGTVYQYTGTNWQATNNIQGPQGIQGIQGIQGEVGPQGPVGPQGIQGPAGAAFSVIGLISSTSQLPDPSTVPDNYAYLVGTSAPYDLYVQVVPEGEPQQWLDAGKVEGVVGPQGPQGPQGEIGPTGPQGQAATIQVGTVTTLEPGESATVTNSGTSGAAVFNFGIPKGEQGAVTGYVPHIIRMYFNENYGGTFYSIVHAPLSTRVTHDNYRSLAGSYIPVFGYVEGSTTDPVVSLRWQTPAPNVVQLVVNMIGSEHSHITSMYESWDNISISDMTYNANATA